MPIAVMIILPLWLWLVIFAIAIVIALFGIVAGSIGRRASAQRNAELLRPPDEDSPPAPDRQDW